MGGGEGESDGGVATVSDSVVKMFGSNNDM